MIDFKMVEFSIYVDILYLFMFIIIDFKKVIGVL